MTIPVDDTPPARRWLRPAVLWFVVCVAHAGVLVALSRMSSSPQVQQALDEIVQAKLIAPPTPTVRPPEPSRPPKPSPPRRQPPRPAPVLAAAPVVEPPPASFVVPTPPADPVPADSAPTPVDPAPAPPLIPPTFDADYLENPSPQYPLLSRRLGEKGRVLLRVFVSADGRAERVEVRTSSGFDRLDDAAREAVVRWRFVPARRGEERVAAWVQVPIVFVM